MDAGLNIAVQRRRALVVHHAPAPSEQILSTLREAGCETIVSPSAQDALRSIDRFRIDLIVMEAEVEYAFQEFAERLYARAGVPVLYVCSSTGAIGFRTLSRGIGFLTPPFDLKYTQALIRRALRGPGSLA